MRVLIINKFLYPNGGSETYIFKLGEALEQHGHEVQYFGMEHEGRCVGNRVNKCLMLQLLLRLGTFQLSDIFYNTVGGVLGGLMYCGIMKARKRL